MSNFERKDVRLGWFWVFHSRSWRPAINLICHGPGPREAHFTLPPVSVLRNDSLQNAHFQTDPEPCLAPALRFRRLFLFPDAGAIPIPFSVQPSTENHHMFGVSATIISRGISVGGSLLHSMIRVNLPVPRSSCVHIRPLTVAPPACATFESNCLSVDPLSCMTYLSL